MATFGLHRQLKHQEVPGHEEVTRRRTCSHPPCGDSDFSEATTEPPEHRADRSLAVRPAPWRSSSAEPPHLPRGSERAPLRQQRTRHAELSLARPPWIREMPHSIAGPSHRAWLTTRGRVLWLMPP